MPSSTSNRPQCPYHNRVEYLRSDGAHPTFTIRVHDDIARRHEDTRWFNLRMSGAICTCNTTGAADRND